MDRLIGGAALAAVALSLALAGCGGGGGGAAADAPPSTGGTPGASIQGVSTPSSVSVVTAKNAQ